MASSRGGWVGCFVFHVYVYVYVCRFIFVSEGLCPIYCLNTSAHFRSSSSLGSLKHIEKDDCFLPGVVSCIQGFPVDERM